MSVAHIGHVELIVSDLEASADFFTRVLGLYVSDETGDRVYLRSWQDRDHHTLLLTRGESSSLGHIGWRVTDEPELAAAAERLRSSGVESTWVEGGAEESGHGDAVRFRTPSGVPMELYWEVDRYVESSDELKSVLPSHPQKYTGRGVAPRRFDHVNCLVSDVAAEQEWLTDQLGIHHRYYLLGEGEKRLGSWMSRTSVSHEIALMRNKKQDGSFLHHVGFYSNSPDEVVRAATILAESGTRIEWGPGCHGTSGAIFLYCFEPSGHRVEVWTGGMLIFEPDWAPIEWSPETAATGLELWGSSMPESYLTYGTPIADLGREPEVSSLRSGAPA